MTYTRPTSTDPEGAQGLGDPAERVVAELSPQLYRYAVVRLGQAEVAEEAVAETFFRLVQKGPPLDGPPAYIHGWCVRCLVNICRELTRKRQLATLDAGDEVACGYRLADWQEGLTEDVQMLATLMGHLSERQHEAVTLRVLMGLPVAHVASIMSCAEGTIKALTHQGIAALRRMMADRAEAGDTG